jgi:two-component system, OmpR family, sensor histidine kinase ResE
MMPTPGDNTKQSGQHDTAAKSEFDRATSDFITVVAHKIHTPVTSMMWSLEMLASGDAGDLSDDQKEFVKSIENSLRQLNDLSRALLYVFELEKDLPMVQPQDMNMSKLLRRSIGNLAKLAQEHKVNVYCDGCELEQRAFVDPELAFLIMHTLIGNAIRYSASGSEVKVYAEESSDGSYVHVDDQGCGIPSTHHNLVFTKFFRAPNAKKIWTDGTGLNLFVVKNIVERTGGDITFESAEGKGTKFCWKIPKRRVGKQPWQR